MPLQPIGSSLWLQFCTTRRHSPQTNRQNAQLPQQALPLSRTQPRNAVKHEQNWQTRPQQAFERQSTRLRGLWMSFVALVQGETVNLQLHAATPCLRWVMRRKSVLKTWSLCRLPNLRNLAIFQP
jgi:hypothetical protein